MKFIWEEDLVFMADLAPVILTEFGFAMTEEEEFYMSVKGDIKNSRRITDFASKKGVS